jgi:hypothetical protein
VLRRDGDFIIYIIQFKYKDSEDNTWHNAGDCGQFLPKMFRDERLELEKIVPLNSLTACGHCWQETGVSGTYNFDDALKVMSYISQKNPGRKFRVSEVRITQKTIQKCCMEF